MEDKAIALIHLDYGEYEHGYILYSVAKDHIDEAMVVAHAAVAAWDNTCDSKNTIEEAIETAFHTAAIRFEPVEYEPLRVAV